ncbi:MAG: hypothetical protein HGA95_01030 [Caldiserica bacterium]|nr:hypothetical protein [Caldisericota bacterium]
MADANPVYSRTKLFDWGVVSSISKQDGTFTMNGRMGHQQFSGSSKLIDKLDNGESFIVCFDENQAKEETKAAIWAFKTDKPFGRTYAQFFAGSSQVSMSGFAYNLGSKPYMSGETMMIPINSVSAILAQGYGGKWDAKDFKLTMSFSQADLVMTIGSKEILFGAPAQPTSFIMSHETEFHDGRIYVSYEVLSVFGAGSLEFDSKLGKLTVVTDDQTYTAIPYAYWSPVQVTLANIDCNTGTAQGVGADGTKWLMDLDTSKINCSSLKVGQQTKFFGYSYLEDGAFKIYCDSLLSPRYMATKEMFSLSIDSCQNEMLVAKDKQDSTIVIKKPYSDWMRVGTNWKCYGYINWFMNVTKAREIDPSNGKLISCGYFKITQEGKNNVVTSDEYGTERKMIVSNVPWQADKMLKKGLRYLVRYVDNPDGSLKVIDFKQANDNQSGLVFANGKLSSESCTMDNGKKMVVKFDQPFLLSDKLYVSVKVFRQYGFAGHNFEETETTDNLELVTFKAGSNVLTVDGRQITLSSPPIVINYDLMVPFEDFAKIFAKSHSYDKETGEFSAEMYAMPTFSYTDSATIQISKIDKANLTISGTDDLKKQWSVYFWDAKLLDKFQTGKVYTIAGVFAGERLLIGCSNITAVQKQSITENMETENIIMGSVVSVKLSDKTVGITDTDGKLWTVKDNGNDLKLLSVGQKLIIEATKDKTPVVLRRWTMKTLPTPKVVKSTVRFNSVELDKDGKKYKCAQLDMINGVLMFDYTMLMQMLPSRVSLSGSRLDVWYWGKTISFWKDSENALLDYVDTKLPAFSKTPLFELPVFWTLDNLGVRYFWDADSKVLTVEAKVLPIPHDNNYENLEMKGKVVYAGVGLVKINDGKKDILVYPNDLSFVTNVKKNNTVWLCGMRLNTDDGYVYSDLVLPVLSEKPTIISGKVTKTVVNGNPKCFELMEKSGKTMVVYSSFNLKSGGLYKTTIVPVANTKNHYVATMIEGIDQY